jgi:hypothetical protein
MIARCHIKPAPFSLTSPEDAMRALISKWILQALLPAQSNVQAILRYPITQLQPPYHGSWGPSSLWLFSLNFYTKGGSKVWHHMAQFWKVMARKVAYAAYLSPSILEDIKLCSFIFGGERNINVFIVALPWEGL